MTDRVFKFHKDLDDFIRAKVPNKKANVSGKFYTPYNTGLTYIVHDWDDMSKTVQGEITAILSARGYEFLEDV